MGRHLHQIIDKNTLNKIKTASCTTKNTWDAISTKLFIEEYINKSMHRLQPSEPSSFQTL